MPRKWRIRGLATGLTLAIGMLPSRSRAAPDAPTASDGAEPETAPESDAEARAIALYDEGQAFYSAANYEKAIDKFTEALALIASEDTGFDAEARGLLLYNLATAYDRSFNIDPDPKHLRASRELYQRIVDEAEANGYSDELASQATEARDRVDARLREAAAAAEPDAPPPAEPAPTPSAPPPPTDAPKAEGRGLVVAGASVLGVGVASSGIWIAGILMARGAEDDIAATTLPTQQSERIDAFDRGELGDTLVITGAVVSGALVVTGAVLLGLGLEKRGKVRTAWAPAVAPGFAGLRVGGRF